MPLPTFDHTRRRPETPDTVLGGGYSGGARWSMETEDRNRKPKRYTAAEKARVAGDVVKLGIRSAGRRHAVPIGR